MYFWLTETVFFTFRSSNFLHVRVTAGWPSRTKKICKLLKISIHLYHWSLSKYRIYMYRKKKYMVLYCILSMRRDEKTIYTCIYYISMMKDNLMWSVFFVHFLHNQMMKKKDDSVIFVQWNELVFMSLNSLWDWLVGRWKCLWFLVTIFLFLIVIYSHMLYSHAFVSFFYICRIEVTLADEVT